MSEHGSVRGSWGARRSGASRFRTSVRVSLRRTVVEGLSVTGSGSNVAARKEEAGTCERYSGRGSKSSNQTRK